ncbi:RNA 3'-terminal phosphate cyclase [Rosistilla oblonga]|uniref:RNA 3'-terminal phosphate cyclase n=1 Tax=Rosistilla oblonga TaxID=2527990 RepID=UPI003A97421B
MIEIDGSRGEGGGQILRTSLALSMVTGQPVRFVNIRAARSRPGLLRQHLTGVKAAAAVSGAKVDGDRLGSTTLTFEPSKIQAGDYHFAIGSAGSCLLVLQTILPALMIADGPSRVDLEGGTHNPFAPPFEFLELSFLPLLKEIGPEVRMTLDRPGFYPAGGGRCNAAITPAEKLQPIELIQRGKLLNREALAIVSRLPAKIAARELETAARTLGWPKSTLKVEPVTTSPGPGNALLLSVSYENVTEVVTGFGDVKVSAERVAKRAAGELKKYLNGTAPVGSHLADQLLLPLAMAGGGQFRCQQTTQHTLTNIETIKMFLDLEIDVQPQEDESVLIRVG